MRLWHTYLPTYLGRHVVRRFGKTCFNEFSLENGTQVVVVVGSIGRAVASDTRGSNPVFGKKIIINQFTFNCCKDENKAKEASNGAF